MHLFRVTEYTYTTSEVSLPEDEGEAQEKAVAVEAEMGQPAVGTALSHATEGSMKIWRYSLGSNRHVPEHRSLSATKHKQIL